MTTLTEPLNIRVKKNLKKNLQSISKITDRSMSYHAQRALSEYFDREGYIIQKIEEGLIAADKEDFASTKSVDSVFNKYA